MDLNTKVKRSAICAGVRVVRSARLPVSAVIANLYMESFEEQAITTSSYKPTIWKRYVDDTFTILDRGNVDDFLQHLNNQQPSIRFTMGKNTCHLFWFLMVILFLSCRNSPRPEDQTTVPNPPSSSKLLRFCLMSKVCPNNFAAPYNNKAYALFSSRRLR